MTERQHRFLKIASVVFTVLSWLSLLIGLLVAIVVFAGGGEPQAPRAAGFFFLVLWGIFFFVFATLRTLIRLYLELEAKGK